MTLQEMRTEVARNVNVLTDDGIISSGRVTQAAIDNKINQIYRDVIGQKLMSKYPNDFIADLRPQQTFTNTSTISDVSGTTITAAANIFSSYDVGCQIENPTRSEKARIQTYNNPQQVIVETAPTSDWVGDTVYVLGNHFTLGGQATDLKEFKQIKIKYQPDDTPAPATFVNYRDTDWAQPDDFSKYTPAFRQKAIKTTAGAVNGIEIMPRPTSYLGEITGSYVEQPPKLVNDTDTPRLAVVGISEALIMGASAHMAVLQGDYDRAQQYRASFQEALEFAFNSYRPKSSNTITKRRLSPKYLNIKRGATSFR